MSSKSKCEQDLDAMTVQRDHWKAKHDDARADAEIARRMLKGGIVDQMREVIKERNALQDRYEQWLGYCDLFAANLIQDAHAHLGTMHETIQSLISSDTTALPISGQIIIGGIGNSWAELGYNTEQLHRFMTQLPISERAGLVILALMFKMYAAGAIKTMARQSEIAAISSNDPALLADLRVRQLQDTGKVEMDVLRKLPLEWVKSNLPTEPSAHETLAQGLQVHQEFLNSGEKQTVFARTSGGGTERRLREYAGWYRALEKAAKGKPKHFRIETTGNGETRP